MLHKLDYEPPVNNGLDVIYQDPELLIVNKPSGLLSVPGRGEHKSDCMYSRVLAEYGTALVVHRLDMPTSGLMLFALSKSMQSDMSKLFENRKISKQYVAIVSGHPGSQSGVISQPLITDWLNRPKQKIDYSIGKPSITRYKVSSYEKNNTRVELIPETGRSHQLRIHMSSIGHPILGDDLYGTYSSRNASHRLLLHAEKLVFRHPETGSTISVTIKPEF